MARQPRLVVPGIPHHVTQRGVRRQQTFFSDDDYQLYLSLLQRWAGIADVGVQAYCLMPNHVHLIVVPRTRTGLSRLFRGLHSQYAEIVNGREGWSGHLWQQRFASCPMSPAHLVAGLDYVIENPVRAGLVVQALAWPWSSAPAHFGLRHDPLLEQPPLVATSRTRQETVPSSLYPTLRSSTRSGRPVGPDEFIASLAKTKPATSRARATRALGELASAPSV
jgi:putative transposase